MLDASTLQHRGTESGFDLWSASDAEGRTYLLAARDGYVSMTRSDALEFQERGVALTAGIVDGPSVQAVLLPPGVDNSALTSELGLRAIDDTLSVRHGEPIQKSVELDDGGLTVGLLAPAVPDE